MCASIREYGDSSSQRLPDANLREAVQQVQPGPTSWCIQVHPGPASAPGASCISSGLGALRGGAKGLGGKIGKGSDGHCCDKQSFAQRAVGE